VNGFLIQEIYINDKKDEEFDTIGKRIITGYFVSIFPPIPQEYSIFIAIKRK